MKSRRNILAWVTGSAFAAASCAAAASGMGILENGASGLGNAYAGGAAIAADASTIYFNPAGMTYLPDSQLVVAADAIKFSSKFSDTGSALPFPRPLGNDGGDAGSLAWVPNAYFAMAVNPSLRVGLGVSSPFGLKTDYSAGWIGRFQALKSKVETVNLNPSVAYQLNDAVSLGFGLDYQRIRGELTSAVNLVLAEGATSVTGSDAAWGYNFGALFKLSPQTRVGLAYRSRIKYNMNGSVTFTGGVPVPNGPATLAITMPDSFSASVFHQLDAKWDVMADATWTGWSVLQQLNVLAANGAPILSVQENWRDTWRVSAGASYHYSEQWLARFGVSYDQTPVPDAYLTARIPDASRYELTVGGQYKLSKDNALDFAYSHLFMNNASINNLQGATAFTPGNGNLVGNYKDSADILSVQYTHNF
jgi:long-chain fatty acid transport protein